MTRLPAGGQFEFTSTMTVTQPEQDLIGVSKKGWTWLRDGIDLQNDPVPWAREAAWACLGIGIALGLGWLTWEPVYAALPDSEQMAFSNRGPIMLVGSIAFIVLTAVFFATSWQVGKVLKKHRNHLLAYMDGIYVGEQPSAIEQ